jgi:alkanesulfonate monooxygenase SsuD/methylene tetrahydromethanopterin reductase-like flavin-dependent oxidoreductase (luciferase family)
MKFGLFYLGNNPKPIDGDDWEQTSHARWFREWLEQIEYADRLGFDYVLVGEHHFMGEFSDMSAPDVFMSAITQRTRNIRIGSAIMQLSTRHNHPARVAERVSTLDALSNGRFEFGTGPGLPFETNPVIEGIPGERERVTADANAIWQENLEETLKMMAMDPYPGCDRTYLKMPPVSVVPKPVQRAHPPVWRPSVRPESVERVASLGLGCFMLGHGSIDTVDNGVRSYWNALRQLEKPIGPVVNPATAAFVHCLVAPTDEAASDRGRAGVDFYSFARERAAETVGQRAHLGRDFVEFRQRAGKPQLDFGPTAMLGSPDSIRVRVREFEQTNVDALILVQQNGDTRHEHIMESLDLFARRVMPEFKDRQEEHARWRALRLLNFPYPTNASV